MSSINEREGREEREEDDRLGKGNQGESTSKAAQGAETKTDSRCEGFKLHDGTVAWFFAERLSR